MWSQGYVREIQRQLIAVYGLPENPEKPGIPLEVPDGEYPMTIGGQHHAVRVVGGKLQANLSNNGLYA